MDTKFASDHPIFPALNKKRKMSELTGMYNTKSSNVSNKIFQILTRTQSGGPLKAQKSSILQTYRPRKFDINRATLFQKPKHQMSVSKLGDDTTMNFDDLSKSRPFSLEERNFNTNDLSFTRILRSENHDSPHNLSKNHTLNPPSFYKKDIERWQNKFKESIKSQAQLYKMIDHNEGSKTDRYAYFGAFLHNVS